MDIHVINLDDRPRRLDHMRAELGRLGLDFERFPAILGTALVATEGPHRRLTPGTFGCLSSHLGVIRRIAASGAPFGLVLEDDLHFTASAPEVLAHAEAWIPADADVVKIESNEGAPHLRREPAARWGRHTVHEILSRYTGGGAYVVTAKGAARLAGLMPRDIDVSIDALLFDPEHHPFEGLKIYQMLPAVVIQDIRSDIHDPTVFASDTDAEIMAGRAMRERRRGRLNRATREFRHALRRRRADLVMALRHGFGKVMRTPVELDHD